MLYYLSVSFRFFSLVSQAFKTRIFKPDRSKRRKSLKGGFFTPILYKYFLCFLFLLLSSCTLLSKKNKLIPIKEKKIVSAKKKEKTTAEHKLVHKAIKKSGFLTKNQINQLQKILKNKKTFVSKDLVRMILGRHFLKKSNYKQALSYYSQVQTSPWKIKALLKQAQIYYKINKLKKALTLIQAIGEEKNPPSDLLLESQLLKLSLVLKNKNSNPKEILETYCHILSYETKKNPIYREQAKRIIFKMSEKDLLDLHSEDFIEPVKDLVFFRSGKILFFRENFRKAYTFFKKFLRSSKESLLEEKALKYIQAIESRKKVNRKRVGAILPLSGPSANIGKRSLKGLKMGLGLHTSDNSPFELVVLDSQGQPDKTKKAVQTLVTKHHVIAVIGGVLSKTASASAEEAQNFGVPALLLSQKSNLTKTGNYIFQNGLTAVLFAHQLTDYLINELNFKRFAILYPNDPFGVDYANAFWAAIEKKGGKITGAQFYKPGETDFNGPIRRLTGIYYLEDRIKEYKDKLKKWYIKKSYLSKRRASPPENILPPIVDFEVLFVPDSIKTLSLIAPHITYNDIKNITLAGPSLWNQEKKLKKYSKHADHIIFADPGFNTKRFKQTDFYKQFLNTFNYKPGLFETLSYESALLLRQIIASGADSRHELRDKLKDIKKFYGPIGEILISKKREFIRPMQIFKMEKAVLSPVIPSSRSR
ncbi:MAG: ABC transporter substrate-binding protein [Bdellovibrionales bacterium]|nr:ABC transporter substrate-binding protein [Bdellovibrionales bacterium]